MAKKKPGKSGGKKPKRRPAASPRGPRAETPLERAQELVYEALEEPDERRRIQLAREALRISPDCADAHVLLAEHAPTRRQSLEEYGRAVAAGERALGPAAFRDAAGHFWGILETRPYMRARLGLAHSLWAAGRRDEAVGHLRDMLRLNPNDNQGVRYTLAGFLLFLDRDDDLARLLGEYPDEASAAWDYTRALLAFRRHGDTDESRRLLKRAVRTNRHVPDYLTGAKQPPAREPDFISPGDESEAREYAAGFLAAWKYTPGAIAWLRASVAKPKAAPKAKGPTASAMKSLAKLPQEGDVWQAEVRELPGWIHAGGTPVRPWAVLVMAEGGLVLAHELAEERPAPELVWDALARAMRRPAAGKPHRPAAIAVRPGAVWDTLRPHLGEIGVALETRAELKEIDSVFSLIFEPVLGERRPGLLEVPGMTPARAGSFYAAAAEFYRRMPWKRVGYEAAIRVGCDKFESGPWFAVLMGQSGMTAGLALYDDLNVLGRMLAGGEEDEQNARDTVGTSVTFGEEWDANPADVEAVRSHGWDLAGPDAYPDAFRKERGMSMRQPLAWELELLEGCLRAVPEFVRRRPQDDPTREEIAVPTGGGGLILVLSWVLEEELFPPGPGNGRSDGDESV